MRLACFVLILLISQSCKKEATTWDSELSSPLISSNMGIGDLVADSLLEIQNGTEVALTFEENLFSIGIDSLIDIEPDTVTRIFTISPLLQFTFNPGQTFYNVDESFQFAGIEAQLSQAILKQGAFNLRAENSIYGNLNFILKIPKATKNGQSLVITETIPAADTNGKGILDKEINLIDYDLDLTALNGTDYNKLDIKFTLTNPINGEPISVTNTDSVKLELSYSSLDVRYAQGYFGSENIDLSESQSFNSLNTFNSAIIDLNEVETSLVFTNGFGVDIQASIFQLKGWNSSTSHALSLNSDFIGSNINMSRANISGESIFPFEKTISLNNSNSNITELVELLPDSFKINAQATLNPFGNIANYNDFITDQSTLNCDLKLKIPLKLSLTNLILQDTTAIEWPTNENYTIQNGSLYVLANNSFPSNIYLELKALDSQNIELLDLTAYSENQNFLIAGSSDHTAVSSLFKFVLDSAALGKLEKADKVAFKAKFETTDYPQEVTFLENDSLQILISTDINTQFSY